MKWRILLLATGAGLVFASCGGNSSKKDTVVDTVVASNTSQTTNNASVSTVEVPMGIKTSFEEKYPQASNVRWDYYRDIPDDIDWEWSGWPAMDTMDYVTNYNWQGTDYMSWYDDQGNWVGTVSNISDYGTLPAAVNSVLNSQYNGYTITSVKRENDKSRSAYQITIEKGSDHGKLLVDENGKILKKKMTADGTTTKEKMNPKDSIK